MPPCIRLLPRSLLCRPHSRAYAQTPPKPKPRMDTSLTYTPERGEELRANVEDVLKEIDAVKPAGSEPRLVAISKIKPPSDIQALYDAGHRHFGENYIQELSEKASILPSDINWHFVGSLQSNKTKLLTAIPNLYVLETLSTKKLADLLQKSPPQDRSIRVYLQLNTSGEDSKSGLPMPPDSALLDLAAHVRDNCPNLTIAGLMTIGSWEASHAEGENPDFLRLKEARKVMEEAGFTGLELSMGMSADFCEAVKEGSGSVRVGTRIFGARPKKQ